MRARLLLRRIPASLVILRLCLAPAVIVCGGASQGVAMAWIILAAMLSDIFDGIIARRLGVATITLRRADSIVDLIFWLSVLAALYRLDPTTITRYAWVFAAIVGVELLTQALCIARFRRMTATHARSAKLAGICLTIGCMMISLGSHPAAAVWLIAAGNAVSAIDVIAIVLILPRWEADVSSLRSAARIRRGLHPSRHWLG